MSQASLDIRNRNAASIVVAPDAKPQQPAANRLKDCCSPKDSSVRDYFELMKPRVMSLVVFTAFVGMMLAPGTIHPLIGFTAILLVSIGAGSAAAINMWFDRDIDSVMKRTQKRPIVTGRIAPEEALSFGIITGLFSVILMGICVNLVAAGLLLLTILYYIFVYTIWLKRSSIMNVVVGGAAGAFPPMIGWAAVNGEICQQSFALFAIIFVWTPPHSWALALHRLQDYRDCKVPMMPVIRGDQYTKWQIIYYTLLMVATSYAPYWLGMSNYVYAYIATIANLGFVYYAMMLFLGKSSKTPLHLFIYTILYLFALFLGLLVLIPYS